MTNVGFVPSLRVAKRLVPLSVTLLLPIGVQANPDSLGAVETVVVAQEVS